MTVLDCGCGLNPRGDFNVDLFIDSTHRRSGKGPELDTSQIPNFISCDIRDMSEHFHDRQFSVVVCKQTLEHILDWRVALREMWRVCDKHLIVEVPSRHWLPFPKLRRSRTHISNFDASVFREMIPRILLTKDFEVITRYRGMFHKLIPFPSWPHIVRVDVWR